MTVKELYTRLENRIPKELSEPWDNDGLMCCSDALQEIHKILITLDVTEDVVDYAMESGVDLIISHHPLIFKPLTSIREDNHVARKIIKLLASEITVMSFHTRLDKVSGGVNDYLCGVLGIEDAVPFGEGDLGRIGYIPEERLLDDFALHVKECLEADVVRVSDALNPVRHVAIVGGDGKSYVKDAIALGADTYVSGRIGYNVMEEAAEMGINLIEAGHYFTEQPITEFLRDLLYSFDPTLSIEIISSNQIKSL
jgi:dinuclear metal center YbgI/SA1388 family protein